MNNWDDARGRGTEEWRTSVLVEISVVEVIDNLLDGRLGAVPTENQGKLLSDSKKYLRPFRFMEGEGQQENRST